MFAESKELKVVQKDSYHTSLSCEYGEMTFWSANAYYAWASTGSYKANGCVGGELWNGEMPSRYAVRKLVKAMRAKKFALPVPSTEKEAA